MFKRRTVLLLTLAGLLASSSAWYANKWVNKNQAPVVVEEKRENVVVAAIGIPYGQAVEVQHLKMVSMPAELVPSGAYTDMTEVKGKIATAPILEGEMLRRERFSEHLGGSTLAALIEPKKRAITVRVNDVVGVAGFLLPGNKVDILSSRKVNKRVVTDTVLQDIKVLAVDQTSNTDKNEPVIVRAVTLEMTPNQTEKLVKARDEGTIQLTLRNPVEEVAKVEPKKKPVVRVAKKRAPGPSLVTVIRGVSAEKTKVQL